ncbi:hypothetical protein HOY82DRAFT_104026 [Tuber indicum]|nr:hypothetical protein HOY82DRAFT_104026 [Tuber indicum]
MRSEELVVEVTDPPSLDCVVAAVGAQVSFPCPWGVSNTGCLLCSGAAGPSSLLDWDGSLGSPTPRPWPFLDTGDLLCSEELDSGPVLLPLLLLLWPMLRRLRRRLVCLLRTILSGILLTLVYMKRKEKGNQHSGLAPKAHPLCSRGCGL